jgi:hypothetical protein
MICSGWMNKYDEDTETNITYTQILGNEFSVWFNSNLNFSIRRGQPSMIIGDSKFRV